ncbi:MAG: hypothetical protein E7265_06475 [Lachnospiraceae bacterium]|nr:hypothetical protein [Lachnospiraceae bacterium]
MACNNVKLISHCKDIKEKVTMFQKTMSCNYRKSSLLEIVMEYFTLCEMITENLNPELEEATEELEVIDKAISLLADNKSVLSVIDDFSAVRSIITDKMDNVTAYVDKLLVYEYVLSRRGMGLEMSEIEIDSELSGYDMTEFARDILQYIFAEADNMIVNERIHEIMECLPVRMSRKKYLALVKSGLSLYSDSDKASFDEYVYMLRTSSMLYACGNKACDFSEIDKLCAELAEVDYKNLGKDYYLILRDKLDNATVKLGNLSDVYICLVKIINMLYVYAINETCEIDSAERDDDKFNHICNTILAKLHEHINDESASGETPEQLLVNLEGYMEELYEERCKLVPMGEELGLVYGNIISELNMEEQFDKLEISKRLMDSYFADIKSAEYEEVSSEYVEEATDSIISEMEELFANSNKLIVKAIIALTMGKLPMPFTTSEDVKDYVVNALEHCTDKSELVYVKKCVDDII